MVVIDSVTPLNKIFGGTIEVRNYSYKIATTLSVVVDEVGAETTDSPILGKNTLLKTGIETGMSYKYLSSKPGGPYPREYVYAVYQADTHNLYITSILFAIIISNNLETLIIVYTRSFGGAFMVSTLISSYGKEIRITEELIRKLFKKDLIVIESINPASLSIEEPNLLKLHLIDKHGSNTVVLNKAKIPKLIHGQKESGKYLMYLRDKILRPRDPGVVSTGITVFANEGLYRKENSVPDTVLRFGYVYENNILAPRVFA